MPKRKVVSYSSGKRYSREELLEVFSRMAAIYAFQDPIRSLENKIKRKAWFEGVVLAATLLESLGSTKLKVHLKGEVDPDKIDHLTFEQTIIFLFGTGVIRQSTYSQMMEIKDARNKLVHEVYSQYRLEPKEAKILIRKAIECFKELGYNKQRKP